MTITYHGTCIGGVIDGEQRSCEHKYMFAAIPVPVSFMDLYSNVPDEPSLTITDEYRFVEFRYHLPKLAGGDIVHGFWVEMTAETKRMVFDAELREYVVRKMLDRYCEPRDEAALLARLHKIRA